MSWHCFLGATALSPFRLQQLNDQLESSGSRVTNCYWLYLVELEEGAEFDKRLSDLLGTRQTLSGFSTNELAVVPRLGTLSAWSTKATDIAHRCHIKGVSRIERGRLYVVSGDLSGSVKQLAPLFDRMTESIVDEYDQLAQIFDHQQPKPISTINLGDAGMANLQQANADLGLALSAEEIEYLVERYAQLGRNPSDAELMMFAQANSEHCRHKIFNASWTIDGRDQDASLFGMIRKTARATPEGLITAYSDNAAIIAGGAGQRFWPDAESRYCAQPEDAPMMIKVETHNHPTAISPFPGAATGSGGEIRDEAATGRGGKPKAGLVGYSVSNLKLPKLERPWEEDFGKPDRIASALDIMIEAPIGAARFNNEFGRPALGGYFRTYEQRDPNDENLLRGYHKPIMIAGGMGVIRPQACKKNRLGQGDLVVVLGGPSMLIGLGGGAASSKSSGVGGEELDFASVQRGNPEMERRCQEVIDRCWALGEDNPIIAIHDVGAGGLSNAIPELLEDSEVGGDLDIRAIPSADSGMSPMEIWCNESQERYVMAIAPYDIDQFMALCERERCPASVLGTATQERHLLVQDSLLNKHVVDVPMSLLFGSAPKMHRTGSRQPRDELVLEFDELVFNDAVRNVLRMPSVASKQFLITIGDRSVGGLSARDQMVGPWQTPVADVAATLKDFAGYNGEAMAMGERTPLAVTNGPASGRMAVGEALTNLFAAPIDQMSDIKLSANWMAAAGSETEDAVLFDTVAAVGDKLCPQLGIAIPVGKDSLSMRTKWQSDDGQDCQMDAPVSLIVSAFAPISDVRQVATPQLQMDGETSLILIDLGHGKDRLGGSALAQAYRKLGGQTPDLDNPEDIKRLHAAIQQLRQAGHLLAYHDRSDGGALACVLEMAFAARCGIDLKVPNNANPIGFLFNEELGAVIQVRRQELDAALEILEQHELAECSYDIGHPESGDRVRAEQGGRAFWTGSRTRLLQIWSETSQAIQALRDNPECAVEEFEALGSPADTRLQPKLTFDPEQNVAAALINTGARPRVAILREQGVNGQIEMAAAFDRAGFEAVDVHMTDVTHGQRHLSDFAGLAVCGGFSYGDVLGAGQGWAKSILFRDDLRYQFAQFLSDPARFTLGVCNGCQMLAGLAEIIPGSAGWPQFVGNRSEQFEARFSMVEVADTSSVLMRGMQGARIPVVVSHGEGRAAFSQESDLANLGRRTVMRYVGPNGKAAQTYPNNPNGSPGGITGVCNADGRITLMMPHPERVFRTVQMSWAPTEWGEDSPWMRMFYNARIWTEQANG